MDDFNSAMANIESGLVSASSAASRAQSAASSAQSAANSAQSTANAAKAAANAAYSPDNMPYVIGFYTGTESNQVISLGFMPSFLIITGMHTSYSVNDTKPFDRYFAIAGSNKSIVGQQLPFRLQLSSVGFAVYKAGTSDSQLPILNEPGRTYYYIAFR